MDTPSADREILIGEVLVGGLYLCNETLNDWDGPASINVTPSE